MSKKFDLLIAAGEKSALMRYATAFATPDDYLYFRSDEEAGMIVSPLEYGHYSAYMERVAEAGKPTEFYVDYQYTCWGQHFDLEGVEIAPYDTTSAVYKQYTAVRAPHLLQSESMRQLAAEIVGDETHPYLKLRKIFDYVKQYPWASALNYSIIDDIPQYVLDNKTGEVYAVKAKKTVLATGGVGQVYRHTTNAAHAYGHGIAMAYRVGARVMNMEFMQFHPTVFAKGKSFLISEALRGEGAVLRNCKGEAFMAKYHPLKDLAPRDIVARAIEEERLKTSHDCVYLDITHEPVEHIKERFPAIYETCLKEGVDITKQPIPVVPAAHYFCGGVYATPDGRRNILHLNAIGETACTGYHGANRLASTSLLEAVATGYLCAAADAADIARDTFRLPEPKEWVVPDKQPDLNLIKQDLATLKSTMWNYVGLVRSATHLSRAEKILRHLHNEIDVFYKGYALNQDLLDLRNGTQTALLITYAALKNKQSIGCHYIK